MADVSVLCLKCRRQGHVVETCPSLASGHELGWMFSSARRSFNTDDPMFDRDDNICSRCTSLDLIKFLQSRPAWNLQSEFTEAYEEGHPSILNLGRAGSLQLRADCPVCCCLFAIAPNVTSSEQEVLIIPDWTACRVSGELEYNSDRPEKQNYATCLLVVLKPSFSSVSFSTRAHRGDALCLLESDLAPDRTLGGRRIDGSAINFNQIREWIACCQKRHNETCLPVFTEELKEIRLIDVEARKVVKYPENDCDFVALSYVWGPISPDAYKANDIIKTLPKTLEDALVFTKELGKKYIWIDAVCIDQSDDNDKKNQIDRMWSIYRGAWVTLCACSGESAETGISRMSRKTTFTQVKCRIQGKTLVGLMPTSSQQVWQCPWGQRAWTLQEGLLTPRCLFVSDYQVYYDCAATQCCESLDETRSWGFGLSVSSAPPDERFLTWMERQVGSGGLRLRLDEPSKRLEQMGLNLNLYSYRTMKYDTDAIRAFKGILQKFDAMYPKGYFWASPVEDFDWALLWRSQLPPKRRPGFPSWSWTGWKGPLFFGQPSDLRHIRWIPTDLDIKACKSGQLEQIFPTKSVVENNESIGITIKNDPIDKVMRLGSSDPELNLDQYPTAEQQGHLFIIATCLHFKPDFTGPRRKSQVQGQFEIFGMRVNGVQCLLRITCTDAHIPGRWNEDTWEVLDPAFQETWTCVLVARDYNGGFISHHLLLLDIEEGGSTAERATVFELLVPIEDLNVLEEFAPRKRRLVIK